MTSESKPSYNCKYCNKSFVKESTLAAHACEKKRRAQQEKEIGVQLGLRAYLRFFEVTQGSAKSKTYDDFASGPYYNAFVKFGRHLVGIRAISPTSFIDWLLKANKKLDYWTKDSFYNEWLTEHLVKENYQDALERGIKEMQQYAEDHPELKNGFRDYFRYGNANRISFHISTGRISPWIIFNSTTGVEFLDGLGQDQLQLIMPWIDPDVWQKKFKDYAEEQQIAKEILTAAGL
jgi:hypothetical protein